MFPPPKKKNHMFLLFVSTSQKKWRGKTANYILYIEENIAIRETLQI